MHYHLTSCNKVRNDPRLWQRASQSGRSGYYAHIDWRSIRRDVYRSNLGIVQVEPFGWLQTIFSLPLNQGRTALYVPLTETGAWG